MKNWKEIFLSDWCEGGERSGINEEWYWACIPTSAHIQSLQQIVKIGSLTEKHLEEEKAKKLSFCSMPRKKFLGVLQANVASADYNSFVNMYLIFQWRREILYLQSVTTTADPVLDEIHNLEWSWFLNLRNELLSLGLLSQELLDWVWNLVASIMSRDWQQEHQLLYSK